MFSEKPFCFHRIHQRFETPTCGRRLFSETLYLTLLEVGSRWNQRNDKRSPMYTILPSTQQSGILVGTDKIFLWRTVIKLLSEMNISSLYRLFWVKYISLLFQTVVHYNTLNYIKEFWFSHWSSLCFSWALQSEKFQGTVRWSILFNEGEHISSTFHCFGSTLRATKDQGLNCLLQWRYVLIATGLLRKSLVCFSYFCCSLFLVLADFMIEILCKEFDHTSIYLSILL